jgi:protocatechuate 3,4-dioxygenase beta subunit
MLRQTRLLGVAVLAVSFAFANGAVAQVEPTQEGLDAHRQHSITGTVLDESGNPLSPATIRLWGTFFRPTSKTTTADAEGKFLLRFNPYELDMVRNGGGEPPTPDNPHQRGIRIEVESPGYVWKGVRTADGQFISEPFFSKREPQGIFSRADSFFLTCFEPEPSDAIKIARNICPQTSVHPHKPLSLDLVMQPSVHIRGTILFDEPPEDAAPDDRWAAWQPARLIFDLPRAETASGQPIFYGQANNDFRFVIDAFPQKIDVFLTAGTRQPASWKEDTIVAQTDFFQLPPAGTYDAVLKWETIERHGIRLRRLVFDSLSDADGNNVAVVYTKPSVPIDYLFNRWTLHGTVRDDLGRPIEGAEVRFYRHDGWKPREPRTTVTTNSAGMYEVEIKPGNRYPYKDKLRGAEGGDFYIVRVFKEGFLQKHLETDIAVFLSDDDTIPNVEVAEQESFSFREYSTNTIVAPRTRRQIDFAMDRTAEVNVLLLDDAGQPLSGYAIGFANNLRIDNDFLRELRLDPRFAPTDSNGKLTLRRFLLRVPGWFWLNREKGENDILQTDSVTFAPGTTYHVELRLQKDALGNRRLVLETITGADGNVIVLE